MRAPENPVQDRLDIDTEGPPRSLQVQGRLVQDEVHGGARSLRAREPGPELGCFRNRELQDELRYITRLAFRHGRVDTGPGHKGHKCLVRRREGDLRYGRTGKKDIRGRAV